MANISNSNSTWDGETDHIDKEMLSRHLSDFCGLIYCIVGPPAMLAGMRKMLAGTDADEDDIRSEEFAGYEERNDCFGDPVISFGGSQYAR